ncbi:P-loop containing nucleoside triphosphate hydrolase protein [Annulohypoxylon nitens]|nr:P-loop containing nucleoside triphosphate hydrolase protein [Annulohypoxylon nitens]
MKNEEMGLGVSYTYDEDSKGLRITNQHLITINFPREQTTMSIKTADEQLTKLLPGIPPNLSLITFEVEQDASIFVKGFGIPFGDYQQSETSKDTTITDDMIIAELLQKKQFFFLVTSPSDMLSKILDTGKCMANSRASNPYGNNHGWNVDKYKLQYSQIKSMRPLPASHSFHDDDEHIRSLEQAVVQDVFWLEMAADQIAQRRLVGYFVPLNGIPLSQSGSDTRYMIVKHDGIPSGLYKAAWRRLTKDGSLKIVIYDSWEDEDPVAKWNGTIIDHPDTIVELQGHAVDAKNELVFSLQIPRLPPQGAKMPSRSCMKVYTSRSNAQRALLKGESHWNCLALRFASQLTDPERRVSAICDFRPESLPSNRPTLADLPAEVKEVKLAEINDRMDLHRALLRGNGFYDWMTSPAPSVGLIASIGTMSIRDKSSLRPLPTENFLETSNPTFINVLLDELLPEDQQRFKRYLQCRPLGFGLITAAPGFGKTSIIAVVAALMRVRFGPILCSAPSHVAVSNLAERIYRAAASACERLNRDKPEADIPSRRLLVVRGYKDVEEVTATICILRNPEADPTVTAREARVTCHWKLNLSLAYWVLCCLRSTGVKGLHEDDSAALHDLRAKIDDSQELSKLRDVATGRMSWKEYSDSGDDMKGHIVRIMQDIFPIIDILATTPAATVNVRSYAVWKSNRAMGVVVDEAAAMHRADLYTVWGNTLLPCFLAGDPYQLPPAVLTERETDGDGNLFNRFAATGRVSALEGFLASGMPVFRMRVQLRMARGLFDVVSQTIYNVPPRYHSSCGIENDKFKAGRELEAFITSRYPDVSPSLPDRLSPVFIQCEGTKVETNPTTGSKKSHDQVVVALNLIHDLVRETSVNASQVTLLSPYSANVELTHTLLLREKFARSLAEIGQPSTIDGYQGKENDIVVVVMGSSGRTGPGFTANRHRLNVLLTRQRAGLVVVGDLRAAYLDGMQNQAARIVRYAPNLHALQQVYLAMCESRRVATVQVGGVA